MMRLPKFRYYAPSAVTEAAAILHGQGPGAMVVAGGTDLYPNMKRRHQVPTTLVGLRKIDALRGVEGSPARGVWIGPGTTLTEIEESALVRRHYPGLYQAVHSISTPILRNMGTIGGNICLDTRCNYYDQNYEWRRAINFCMKCDGAICWVAPGSDICLAVSSSDTAPVLCAYGARFHLASRKGERTLEAKTLYSRDGIHYLTKRADEILTGISLPPGAARFRSAYRKLRRREAFDFPVLGVAACLRIERDIVTDARLWLGAVSMAPIEAVAAQAALVGRPLTDETIEEAARLAYPLAKPVDNTDFPLRWRKEMAHHFVRDALREIRQA